MSFQKSEVVKMVADLLPIIDEVTEVGSDNSNLPVKKEEILLLLEVKEERLKKKIREYVLVLLHKLHKDLCEEKMSG